MYRTVKSWSATRHASSKISSISGLMKDREMAAAKEQTFTQIPLVDLKAQYQAIRAEVDAAIQRVVNNASFILGKEVADFENDFAAYVGAKEAVGVASGTAALHLALLSLG